MSGSLPNKDRQGREQNLKTYQFFRSKLHFFLELALLSFFGSYPYFFLNPAFVFIVLAGFCQSRKPWTWIHAYTDLAPYSFFGCRVAARWFLELIISFERFFGIYLIFLVGFFEWFFWHKRQTLKHIEREHLAHLEHI